jgi:hypothetical protein
MRFRVKVYFEKHWFLAEQDRWDLGRRNDTEDSLFGRKQLTVVVSTTMLLATFYGRRLRIFLVQMTMVAVPVSFFALSARNLLPP